MSRVVLGVGVDFKSSLVQLVSRSSRVLAVIVLLVLVALGAYLRMLPAIKYGLELDEADPWSMYWIARHFQEKGLLSFSELRRVTLFWYPYGRDFLAQEYIGTSWLAALTYPIGGLFGLTLRDWIALFPVFAGVATIVLSYVLVTSITGSRFGGLVSASIFSLAPGAIARTTVGFVEKMVVAAVFITLFYILLVKAFKSSGRLSLVYGVLSGVSAGLVAFTWGGYHFIAVSMALIILLDPLVYGRPSRDRLAIYASSMAPFVLLTSLYPGVGYDYFLGGLGLGVVGALLLYAVEVYWDALKLGKLIPYSRAIHAWILAVGVIAGLAVIVTGVLSVPGRLLLALGIREFSPLAESVAEHSPLALRDLAREIGVPLLLSIAGLAYLLYTRYTGRGSSLDHVTLGLTLMALLMSYASYNMAYFLQMSSYYTAVAAGLAVGLWMSGERIIYAGRRRGQLVVDDLRLFTALTLVVVVLLSSAYYAKAGYDVSSVRAPQILTSGLGPLTSRDKVLVPINDAWIRALEYLKANTSEDSLVVTWWDYGYWVSVGAGRRTVADGSTWNETQIRILARILTGNEDEASALLPMFRAEPGKTYLVFYEGYIILIPANTTIGYASPIPQVSTYGTTTIVSHGVADFPKSFQMLRIGYRIDPFAPSPFGTKYSSETSRSPQQRVIHFPGFTGSPRGNVESVLNALIYRLSLEGLTAVREKGLISGCPALANVTLIPSVYDPNTGLIPVFVEGRSKRFAPEAVIVSCFHTEELLETRQVYAVIVFIFKWLG
jgi:dolichyl-diphosphooligosaccharide--protein glycosyltransferase